MGEGVENEFALDFFNRVANKPRNNLIRQVTEGAGDCRSEHICLQEPRHEVDGSTRTIASLRPRCAGMVNKILMRVFLAGFETPSGLFRPVLRVEVIRRTVFGLAFANWALHDPP
jgi:hypothetical protein